MYSCSNFHCLLFVFIILIMYSCSCFYCLFLCVFIPVHACIYMCYVFLSLLLAHFLCMSATILQSCPRGVNINSLEFTFDIRICGISQSYSHYIRFVCTMWQCVWHEHKGMCVIIYIYIYIYI